MPLSSSDLRGERSVRRDDPTNKQNIEQTTQINPMNKIFSDTPAPDLAEDYLGGKIRQCGQANVAGAAQPLISVAVHDQFGAAELDRCGHSTSGDRKSVV